MKVAEKKITTKTFTSSGSWYCPAGITSLNYYLIKNNLNVGPHSFVQIASACAGSNAGNGASFGRKQDGTLWTWGAGSLLGNGTTASVSSPILVIGNHSFIDIYSAGYGITPVSIALARKQDGSIWSWGANTAGALGDGTVAGRSSPVLVVGLHSFIEMTCGTSDFPGGFSAARKETGDVWAWGFNTYGALGLGTTVSNNSPALVIGTHSFIQIKATYSGAAARKQDGTVWTWGYSSSGQNGDNSTNYRSSPVLVVGNHSFVEIVGGYRAVYARNQDGSVWGWGLNSEGEIGDKTTINKSSPILVVGNHSFIKISSNNAASCFGIKQDGTIWAWGNNSSSGSSVLGDGTTNNRSSPILVLIGGRSFTSVFCGHSCSLAQKSNGLIWAWGANLNGQLGNYTTTYRSSPVISACAASTISNTHNFTNALPVSPNTTYNISFYNEDYGMPAVKFGNTFLGNGDSLVISWVE